MLTNKYRKCGAKLHILGHWLLSTISLSSQACTPGSMSVLLVCLSVRTGLLDGNEYKMKQKCRKATKLLCILFPYLDELSLSVQLRRGGACHEPYFSLIPHHSHSAPNISFRLSKQVSSFETSFIFRNKFHLSIQLQFTFRPLKLSGRS